MNTAQIASAIQLSHSRIDTNLHALAITLVHQNEELASQLADYLSFALLDKATRNLEKLEQELEDVQPAKRGLLTFFR